MYLMTIFFNSKRMKHESAIGINFHQVMTVYRQNCPFHLKMDIDFLTQHTIFYRMENVIKKGLFPCSNAVTMTQLSDRIFFLSNSQFSVFRS